MKQVVLLRKDLGMCEGLAAAQASHAAYQFMKKRLKPNFYNGPGEKNVEVFKNFTEDQRIWLFADETLIILGVKNPKEMRQVASNARLSGLEVNFWYEPDLLTYTACAIGPASDELFEGITSHLERY